MNGEYLPMVYRASFFGEVSHLGPSDQALLVDNELKKIPDGYGLYLIPEGYQGDTNDLKNVYLLPENCESGSFVMLSGDGKPQVLST